MTKIIETNSPEETEALGIKLAEQSVPGQVFTLIGDLGVGKTVFTQGFAKGLQIDEPICSPTFTSIIVLLKAENLQMITVLPVMEYF